MEMHKEYTVTFYSPGTLMAETTTKDIPEPNVPLACRMAEEIKERYKATPYGFVVTAYERPAPIEGHEFERKRISQSGTYYINCKVETLAEVKARGEEREKILVSNMEGNGWDKIVKTTRGWGWAQPFREGDKVVNSDGEIIAEG
jgi:hypothetical protein